MERCCASETETETETGTEEVKCPLPRFRLASK